MIFEIFTSYMFLNMFDNNENLQIILKFLILITDETFQITLNCSLKSPLNENHYLATDFS